MSLIRHARAQPLIRHRRLDPHDDLKGTNPPTVIAGLGPAIHEAAPQF